MTEKEKKVEMKRKETFNLCMYLFFFSSFAQALESMSTVVPSTISPQPINLRRNNWNNEKS